MFERDGRLVSEGGVKAAGVIEGIDIVMDKETGLGMGGGDGGERFGLREAQKDSVAALS